MRLEIKRHARLIYTKGTEYIWRHKDKIVIPTKFKKEFIDEACRICGERDYRNWRKEQLEKRLSK